MTEIEARFNQLLDRAYAAAEAADGYRDVLEQTRDFLFRDGATLHSDLPQHGERDIALERHLPQIRTLFERHSSMADREGLNYARLKVRQADGQTEANLAAEKLFGAVFPCRVETLAFDRAALQRIIHLSQTPESKEEVLLARVGEDETISSLAHVRRCEHSPGYIEISISYLDWTPELLSQVGGALGLTQKEQDVFGGFAEGLSQSDVAKRCNRSLETVRSQSKSILRKTGCARISDVVQIAAGLAYLLKQDLPTPARTDSTLSWQTPKDGVATLARPNNRTLAYYLRGSGKRDALFLHGFLQGPFFTPTFVRLLDEADTRLVCPSRPGFGYTSKSASRSDYEKTAVEDALALLDELSIDQTVLVCHQMSTNHAFRLIAAAPDRFRAMVMVSASPPLDDACLKQMDTLVRIAAAAARYTPSVLKLMNEIGIHSHRRNGGPEAFLRSRYKNSPLDLAALDDASLAQPQLDGVFHYIEQGSETLVRDGAACMADWSKLFVDSGCPQLWVHGAKCQTMPVEIVREMVETRLKARFDIVADTSTNLIHQRPDIIVSAIEQFL